MSYLICLLLHFQEPLCHGHSWELPPFVLAEAFHQFSLYSLIIRATSIILITSRTLSLLRRSSIVMPQAFVNKAATRINSSSRFRKGKHAEPYNVHGITPIFHACSLLFKVSTAVFGLVHPTTPETVPRIIISSSDPQVWLTTLHSVGQSSEKCGWRGKRKDYFNIKDIRYSYYIYVWTASSTR